MSLIAVIFFVVIMGFLGVTLASLMSTQASTSAGELSSTQALYVAEGGGEFAQRALAQNLDWYRSAADPIVTPATVLGPGSFTGNIFLPATELSRRVTPASGTIRVFSTARFPASGILQLGHDIGSGEFVQYTVADATTFNVVARDVTVGTVNGGAAGTYARGTAVFPVTMLNALLSAVSATCSPTPTAAAITLAANTKFLPTGTITVDSEEITYTGSSTSGGIATLTGVTRCVNSQSSGASHPALYPVTPLLDDNAAPDFEVFMMSTGSVGSAPLSVAARVVQKTVQR
ncbi:MAG TPA: hypothetical protein VFN94_10805 [Nitrospiria bacterium]|nr:hypothetical protein [Nitrospiria bacterium]